MRGLYLFFHALWIAFATAKFTQPVSSNDDFYQLWTEGDTIDITWDAGWSWGSGEQPKLVDLFITWFDTPKKFSQLLLANVSLAQSGNYTWKVDVPNEKIAQEPKFVLRFSQHTDPEVFNYDLPKMPSRGFILRQKEVATSTLATVTTSTSTLSSSSSSSSATGSSETSGVSPSPSATNSAAEEKSNGAMIAAGVLGGLLATALVLGGVLFFLRRAKKRREAGGKPGALMAEEDYKSGQSYAYSAHELPILPTELGDHTVQSRELNGSTPRDWH